MLKNAVIFPRDLIKNESLALRSLEQLKAKVDMAGMPAVMHEREQRRIGKSSGTTVLALKYDGGVIVAGDRRSTEGYLHKDDTVKVESTGNLTLIACAGTVPYIQELIETLIAVRKSWEGYIEEPIYIDGQATLIKNILKQNFYYLNMLMYVLGYYAVPIMGGYDPHEKRGRIFAFDEAGGDYEREDYVVSGSGGWLAEMILDDQWGKNMSEEEAVRLAIRAIMRASRDIHTSPGTLAPIQVHSVSQSGERSLSAKKALELAWECHIKDKKRRGEKTEYNFFRGEE